MRFFQHFALLLGVLGEIQHCETGACSCRGSRLQPMICFSRYRDNVYLVFINIDDQRLPFAEHLVASLTTRLCGISLKWEELGGDYYMG